MMQAFFIFLLLTVNVLISIWNCSVVGKTWKDGMTLGTWFDKLLLWSAMIQSSIGFSMPILLILSSGTIWYLTSGSHPTLTPDDANEMMQAVLSLWYVLIIFPLLGTGFTLWIYSLRVAYQRRDFSSIAGAGWNSFAQIHNTISAVRNLPGVLADLENFFSKSLNKGSGKSKAALLVIALAIFSLLSGFFIAFKLVRYFADKSSSRIEAYGQHLAA